MNTSAVPTQTPPQSSLVDSVLGVPSEQGLEDRSSAIIRAIHEGNIKDLAGNYFAGKLEEMQPYAQVAGLGLGADGVATAGRALASGSLRPAIGLASSIAAYGGAHKLAQEADLPWYISHPLGVLAASATGNAINPGSMEGVNGAVGLIKKIPQLFTKGGAAAEDTQFEVNPRTAAKMRYGGPNKTDSGTSGRLQRVGRNVNNSSSDETAVVSSEDGRSLKTLDEIARAQANKPYDKLASKDQDAVKQLYDKLRLGERQQ